MKNLNLEELKAQYKAIDLMGWKMNKRSNFIQKEHPTFHPDTPEYYDYWIENMLYHSIEGKWVYDEDQWVWMMPKLFWYSNIGVIIDYDEIRQVRTPIRPFLRDVEWIIFTYLYCCMGFSGFKGDMNITCNRLVDRLEKGEELYDFEKKKLTKYDWVDNDPDTGKLKKYVNAWDYLRTPKLKPLGSAIYNNTAKDFYLLGSRGIGKSYTMSVGDLIHEFLTGGVKSWDDRHLIISNKLDIVVGSAQDDKLQEFLNKAKYFFDNLPGAYGDGPTRINSPFFKKLVGSWKVKQKNFIIHEYLSGDRVKGSGSKIQPSVFTVQNPEAAVGMRANRVYNEEVGLCTNVLDVYAAIRNSLAINGVKFGVSINMGTSGNLDKIQQPQELMTNPTAYDIYSIPNYWEDERQQMGLFIPSLYAYRQFDDGEGNIDLDSCLEFVLKLRMDYFNKKAYAMLESEKIYMPIMPSEMFMKDGGNKYPVIELQEQLQRLKLNDTFDKIAAVGELVWSPESKRGVKFKHDVSGLLNPITTHPVKDKDDIKGALVIYEQPFENSRGEIPKGLYRIVYDPVKLDDRITLSDGISLASILVMKKFQTFDGMVDTVVAEYHGRMARVDNIHELCLKIATYYDGRIAYENNLPGFKEFMRKKGRIFKLEPTPKRTIDKTVMNKGTIVDYGVNMTNQYVKMEADSQIIDWLLSPVGNGEDNRLNVHNLLSQRLIEEMIKYTEKGNFDGISALRLAMIMRLDDIHKPPIEVSNKKKNPLADKLKRLIYSN